MKSLIHYVDTSVIRCPFCGGHLYHTISVMNAYCVNENGNKKNNFDYQISKDNIICKKCGDLSDIFIDINGKIYYRSEIQIPYVYKNPFSK